MRKRLRRVSRAALPSIDPVIWAILSDTELPAGANAFTALLAGDYAGLRPYWFAHRDRILTDWIKNMPGTRPAMWWRFEAPRALPVSLGRFRGTPYAERMIEPRRLLSGGGAPLHEVTAYAPSYGHGIPAWLGSEDDYPEFECQFDYLQRHSLVRFTERRRPDFEPFPHPEHFIAAMRNCGYG